jgi:hypothetical protein
VVDLVTVLTSDVVATDVADYTDSFTALTPAALTHSPRDWARRVLEGASLPMRIFLRLGWRYGLGFPPAKADAVLGWPVVTESDGLIELEQGSWLFCVVLLMCTVDGQLTWTTRVTYRSRLSPAAWAVVGLIHRRFAPRALRRAATGY